MWVSLHYSMRMQEVLPQTVGEVRAPRERLRTSGHCWDQHDRTSLNLSLQSFTFNKFNSFFYGKIFLERKKRTSLMMGDPFSYTYVHTLAVIGTVTKRRMWLKMGEESF